MELQRLDKVKTAYIVIASIFVVLTLLLSVGFYYTILNYKISERRLDVTSLAIRLNIDLKLLYREDIWQAELANTSDEEKVVALNAIIQPLFDEISKNYSNYDLGYYDKRFSLIAAKAPDFKPSMIQKIPRSDPSFLCYKSGKLELFENSTSEGWWNRKGIISVSLPFIVESSMIGHVWVSIKTDDVYQSVFNYSIGVLGFLSTLFFIPLMVTWLLIRKIKRQLISFAEEIFEDKGVQIDTGFLPELTPLLNAVKAYSQQLRTFEGIVRNSIDAISTVDLDYKITSINPAWEKMYGYTDTEVLGQENKILAVPEGIIEMNKYLDRVRLGEDILGYDVKRQRKDGKLIDVSLSISPIRDDRGQITGIMGIHRDITERKKMEAEMQRLDGLNLIGQMAASIAHEIRNPMTTVHGFLQLLGTKPALLEYKDYFQLMIEELDRSNSIITEFLSLSRNTPIELRVQNLNTILDKLLPMLQADALRSEQIIVAELKEIPSLELNEQQIRQVILNLARNGLESMPAGGVLRIRTYQEGGCVVLRFSDQGSGIPKQILENMGKPFLTTKETGTGLGLPVSYNIVYRHGGEIGIETGSAGTTFIIKLPVKSSSSA